MDTDSKPIASSILVEGELAEKILGAAFSGSKELSRLLR
jgi:hypothetical protein